MNNEQKISYCKRLDNGLDCLCRGAADHVRDQLCEHWSHKDRRVAVSNREIPGKPGEFETAVWPSDAKSTLDREQFEHDVYRFYLCERARMGQNVMKNDDPDQPLTKEQFCQKLPTVSGGTRYFVNHLNSAWWGYVNAKTGAI